MRLLREVVWLKLGTQSSITKLLAHLGNCGDEDAYLALRWVCETGQALDKRFNSYLRRLRQLWVSKYQSIVPKSPSMSDALKTLATFRASNFGTASTCVADHAYLKRPY